MSSPTELQNEGRRCAGRCLWIQVTRSARLLHVCCASMCTAAQHANAVHSPLRTDNFAHRRGGGGEVYAPESLASATASPGSGRLKLCHAPHGCDECVRRVLAQVRTRATGNGKRRGKTGHGVAAWLPSWAERRRRGASNNGLGAVPTGRASGRRLVGPQLHPGDGGGCGPPAEADGRGGCSRTGFGGARRLSRPARVVTDSGGGAVTEAGVPFSAVADMATTGGHLAAREEDSGHVPLSPTLGSGWGHVREDGSRWPKVWS